ncbi:UDP-glucosyltransferase 2-like [Aricia agestis]|uniref:UDP-glucosyltransferase 2-like n=1 Tax=Aricia agestis TaxID=91739 RepID=UPI001C20B2EA|nr:UDP-glucosyltransferase 2-like [Aricia agestis]
MTIILLLLTLSATVTQIHSARILAVLQTPSISHQLPFRPVINELVNRGHEVVVITTDPQYPKTGAPKNLTEIDVHDVSYRIWNELMNDVMKADEGIVDQVLKVYKYLAIVFDAQLELKEVKDIVNKRKGDFDLLIVEGVVRPALAFSHVYKVPVIQINSLGPVIFNDHYIGAFTHPILYPHPWNNKIYNLTMWERIRNIYNIYKFKYIYDYHIGAYENEVLRKYFGLDIPPIDEMLKNIQMLILNVHPLWTDNQPVPPNVIYMNNVHVTKRKELPKDLKSFLDSSKNGVVYFSFGSNVIPSALPSDKVKILLETLSKLPYDVLMKWDTEEIPIKAKNIKVSKWLPQSDILMHPKIKVFITQGGLQSLDEALIAGVPVIGIPLFTDQWYNVAKFEKHHIGIRIFIEELTEEALTDAINKIIYSDKSYRENMVRLYNLMQDQPQPPLERVVWWIEHVIRHGSAAHMMPTTANIGWVELLQLDIVVVVVSAISFMLVVLVYVLYKVYKYLQRIRIRKLKKY